MINVVICSVSHKVASVSVKYGRAILVCKFTCKLHDILLYQLSDMMNFIIDMDEVFSLTNVVQFTVMFSLSFRSSIQLFP